MEEALRACVRRALAELGRLLSTDKRAEVAPLLGVALDLDRGAGVQLQPPTHVRLLGLAWLALSSRDGGALGWGDAGVAALCRPAQTCAVL